MQPISSKPHEGLQPSGWSPRGQKAPRRGAQCDQRLSYSQLQAKWDPQDLKALHLKVHTDGGFVVFVEGVFAKSGETGRENETLESGSCSPSSSGLPEGADPLLSCPIQVSSSSGSTEG